MLNNVEFFGVAADFEGRVDVRMVECRHDISFNETFDAGCRTFDTFDGVTFAFKVGATVDYTKSAGCEFGFEFNDVIG